MHAPLTLKRILCVEDNSDVCELIAAILTDCEVIFAQGAKAAWETYASRKFSLIILDYHLADGDGLDLCERIRDKDLQTPIVFITGDDDLADQSIREAGAQRCLRKSNHKFIDELLDLVQSLSVQVA
jgi:CheY-like chemotaxis protein